MTKCILKSLQNKKKDIRRISHILCLFTVFLAMCTGCHQPLSTEWPAITRESKPWTRWWWQGNILDRAELTRTMEAYKEAGFGGLEITPIYGVKGHEKQFINYLSEEWMDMLMYVLKEAERLDLGIDMATGSGWPFGGPWISTDDACKYFTHKFFQLKEGERLREPITFIQEPIVRSQTGRHPDISFLKEPIESNENLQWLALDQIRFVKPLPLQALMAYSDLGEILDLTQHIDKDGHLNWIAPKGNWKLYAIFMGWHGKMVERAAPGAEGNVIDHFSKTAILNYLDRFDQAFENHDISTVRAFFNDSYEVHDAIGEDNWTPDFLQEFKDRRGYDLLYHLPALLGDDTLGKVHIRVRADFRETLSDLLHDNFTLQWKQWAHKQKAKIRNQAHGAPANILDLYAVSDIPETEAKDIIFYKIATSASNITGKPLTSAEAFTWHDEHFSTTLESLKKSVDNYFLGGINHIVYHGTTYSPQEEPWPGWMFYAAVHFGETNTWWEHLQDYNHYVARCQSFLQQGTYDNDVLLYFPFHDFLAKADGSILPPYNDNPGNMPSRRVANWLYKQGYSFDYISDRHLQSLEAFEGSITTSGGGRYKTLLIPDCDYIPLATFEKLYRLALDGITILTLKQLPAEVTGLKDWDKKQSEYMRLKSQLNFNKPVTSGVIAAQAGRGNFLKGEELAPLLQAVGVKRETMVDLGLSFIRKNINNEHLYFIVNRNDSITVASWIPLQRKSRSVVVFDPMNGLSGEGILQKDNEELSVFLKLEPGQSIILKAVYHEVEKTPFPFYNPTEILVELNTPWELSFIEGGPELPVARRIEELSSWTDLDDETCQRFSGTARYTTTFDKPTGNYPGLLLCLGHVAESARIRINGHHLGVLFAGPFQVFIPVNLFEENNILEIEVTNLMANRIIHMDCEDIYWKKFYNINFPARWARNRGKDGLLFNAENWIPFESGLIGPVTLYKAAILEPK